MLQTIEHLLESVAYESWVQPSGAKRRMAIVQAYIPDKVLHERFSNPPTAFAMTRGAAQREAKPRETVKQFRAAPDFAKLREEALRNLRDKLMRYLRYRAAVNKAEFMGSSHWADKLVAGVFLATADACGELLAPDANCDKIQSRFRSYDPATVELTEDLAREILEPTPPKERTAKDVATDIDKLVVELGLLLGHPVHVNIGYEAGQQPLISATSWREALYRSHHPGFYP